MHAFTFSGIGIQLCQGQDRMKFIDQEILYKMISDAIINHTPFSFTRYGDGEGIVMGYPEITPSIEMKKRLDKWFGSEYMPENERVNFSCEMRESVCASDVIGVPGKRHEPVKDPRWHVVIPRIDKFCHNTEDKPCVSMDAAIDMHKDGIYRKLFYGLKRLYYISCRNLVDEISRTFFIPEVEGYHLKPQNAPCVGPILTDKKHYPDCYNDLISNWIPQRAKGNVFLVGAGGLGKVYCTEIKRHGGIALDIGSIMDGWAGYCTRSYLREMGNFRL
jgi:hypothetical protein